MTPTAGSLTERAMSHASLALQWLMAFLKKTGEAIAAEFGVRFANAKQAFENEALWQKARQTKAALDRIESTHTVGMLIDVDTLAVFPLQEGLNPIGSHVLKIEENHARLADSDLNTSTALICGQMVSIHEHRYVFKLFSTIQFAERRVVRQESV